MSSVHNYFDSYFDFRCTRPMTKAIRDEYKGNDLVGVEIGVLYGNHALNMLRNLNIKKLYLIDAYEEYSDYVLPMRKGNKVSDIERIAKHKLSDYNDRIVWIKDYSTNAIDSIKDDLDFVYIDGNHEYEYVLDDIKLYYPHIKSGGFIGGHDADNINVIRAVIDFFMSKGIEPTRRNVTILLHDWWAYK